MSQAAKHLREMGGDNRAPSPLRSRAQARQSAALSLSVFEAPASDRP